MLPTKRTINVFRNFKSLISGYFDRDKIYKLYSYILENKLYAYILENKLYSCTLVNKLYAICLYTLQNRTHYPFL